MIFPLEELIEYKENMYIITAASSRRSYQLSMLYGAKDDDVMSLLDSDNEDGGEAVKVVSLAARQVFEKEIDFRLNLE
jgi:DNA-directed RNA polymerase subunit omega